MIRFCPADVFEDADLDGTFGGGASLTKAASHFAHSQHCRLIRPGKGMAWIQRSSRTMPDFYARQFALTPHPNPLPASAGRGGPSAAHPNRGIGMTAFGAMENGYLGQPE